MFQVGDTVGLIEMPPGEDDVLSLDFVGTILIDHGNGCYGIEWDGMTEGHSVGGMCAYGRGWNVEEQYLYVIGAADPNDGYELDNISGLLF